jgi:hypothetical protein
MKLKIILFSLLAIPSIAFSQVFFTVPMDMLCTDTKMLIETLIKDYQEKPEFVSKDDDGKFYSLWTSKKGKTFTMMVTTTNSNISCVLGVGEIAEKI